MNRRWVVKAGSNLIVSGGPLLLRAWMQQVDNLLRVHGIEVIWVTSGAIASAKERLARSPVGRRIARSRRHELAEKQALSAIGQPLIMDLYNLALQSVSRTGAQILLTYDDLASRARRINFVNTVEKLLALGVVPIVNENDAVATEEIRFGDNDTLSARVAAAAGADRLVILTDVDGLFDADPAKKKSAKLIARVERVTASVLKKAGSRSASVHGTGGMFSKLLAAREAGRRGIETYLVKGDAFSVLTRLAEGRATGTHVGRVASGGER